MTRYDIAVLGGGPGGYVAAIRGSQLGLSVCIIEKEKLGGVCLNWGCIPTKALIKNAEVYNLIKNSEQYGINIDKVSVDFKKNVERSRAVSKNLSKGIEFLMKKNRIRHIVGKGYLKTKNSINIDYNGKTQSVEAGKIIIATGARPKILPGLNADAKGVLTAKEAMLLENPPKDIIIIGSGAIGIEFAYYFNEFGTTVYIVEMMNRILPNEDLEVSEEIERQYKESGIKIIKNRKVLKIEPMRKNTKVHLDYENSKETITAEKVLLAIGVTGNVENLGLQKLGIKTDNGAITIDEYNRTSESNIYAIGDVSGPPWLAHVASAQGHTAVDHSFGMNVIPIDYTNIPNCTYCQPQIGSLGLTEERAMGLGKKIAVGKFSFKSSGRALATNNKRGFVKLIFDTKYGELLGAHIVGAEATEMIAELGIAKALEATWDDLAMTIHAHPTLSEAIMEAAMDARGKSIHQ
tara:strand:+ start:396 stop:1784 length:1389 start_codon:yes stop_codon:yes gene_type:complete